MATFTACCIITDVAADCRRGSSCYCCTNCHSSTGYFALIVIKDRSSIDPVHIVSTNTTLNLFHIQISLSYVHTFAAINLAVIIIHTDHEQAEIHINCCPLAGISLGTADYIDHNMTDFDHTRYKDDSFSCIRLDS